MFIAVVRDGDDRRAVRLENHVGELLPRERSLLADPAIAEILEDGAADHVTIYKCIPHTVIRPVAPQARMQIIPINRDK